jgi:hypothetical protein
MRIFSFGGGVQSNAVMVLQAQGKVNYDKFIFSNVGDDSENPKTLQYINQITLPYCKEHGIEFVELHRKIKGNIVTVLENCVGKNIDIPIPAYMKGCGPMRRECTYHWKVELIVRYLKQSGASKTNKASVGIGISVDEWKRMKESRVEWVINDFPLIEQQITRQECIRIIADAGLPRPPKSSCWFCPYKKLSTWRVMQAEEPELFNKAVALEKIISSKWTSRRKDNIYLTSTNKPLDIAIGLNQTLFEEDTCESGYCMI